jgi:radical SAM family uncharacterized protein/radical SAM-linked protein
MEQNGIQDILPLVRQPSRYLGTEVNVVRKNPDRMDLRMVLAFPDLYEIGMSHFGLQILYHLLNRRPDTVAERVFAPDTDMEFELRSRGRPLVTLESRRPLKDFDIIGISLLYELDYTNILTLLELSHIPYWAADRGEDFPMLIAGGPCTCNPEPVAEFFDAMVIGDGETVVVEMVRQWLAWKKKGKHRKVDLLHRWAQIQGVYIPSFFRVGHDENNRQVLEPTVTGYTRIRRAVVDNLDRAAFPGEPVVPYGRPVHDRLRLEVARGCTRGCRFCQAGMIYRPVRERSSDSLLQTASHALASTGYEDLSLLSLSTGDYSCIEPLMRALMDRCAAERVAVSLPSLRAGTLTPEMMALIRGVRKTGFTIAPEAGSRRLRAVINKNISEEEILETVENAFGLGWQVIKLYFMIGLPTETVEDLQGIVALVKRLRRFRPARRRGQINVGIATFIPKPHTPFQWCEQIPVEVSKERLAYLRDRLKIGGVALRWQPAEVSRLEGLWARGDRRLSRLLVEAHRLGCRLDGWSDHFRYEIWLRACEAAGIPIDFFTQRSRACDEPLPWDHIDSGVSKAYLRQEWEKAQAGLPTGDCRSGTCNQCGVCDFEHIAPVVMERCVDPVGPLKVFSGNSEPTERKVCLLYEKTGRARFLGHLETANVFIRAVRRAGIPVAYSGGFHPKPKISLGDALPLGMESLQERLSLTIAGEVAEKTIVRDINRQLPEGLRLLGSCPPKPSAHRTAVTEYRISLCDGVFDEGRITDFETRTEWVVDRVRPNKMTAQVDLCRVVVRMRLLSERQLELALRASSALLVRPGEVLQHIFGLDDTRLKQALVTKIQTTFEPAVEEP